MFQMLKSLIQDNTWKTRMHVGELHCYYYYAIAGFKLMMDGKACVTFELRDITVLTAEEGT